MWTDGFVIGRTAEDGAGQPRFFWASCLQGYQSQRNINVDIARLRAVYEIIDSDPNSDRDRPR
jgi:hypothetical protein